MDMDNGDSIKDNDKQSIDLDVDKIIEEINKKQCEISAIISPLKEYLTSSDNGKRSNGMQTLSVILDGIDASVCNENEIKCLLEYFIARFSDHNYVIERSIQGLVSICHFKNFTLDHASMLFLSLQNDLPLQILRPESKESIYKLIDYLYKRFEPEFISMGSNFVYGFLRIVDSETSPICLLILFPLFKQIISTKNFESYIEDIFDSIACYFPIIYNRQKQDKHLEMKIKLSQLLNETMTANPLCYQYVLPIAMEKLESESVESKLSSYRLLQMALPTYYFRNVEEYASELWITIRIDSLKPINVDEDELSSNALRTLRELSNVIYPNHDFHRKLMEKIWTDLEISFKTPELQLSCSSSKILIAFIGDHVDVCTEIIQRLESICLQNFLFKITSDEQQAHSLESFLLLSQHSNEINVQLKAENSYNFINSLITNSRNKSNRILQLVLSITNEYVGLTLFDTEQIKLLINFMINSVQQSGYDERLQKICWSFVRKIASKYAELIDEFYVNDIRQEIECNLTTSMNEKQWLFLLKILQNSSQTSAQILSLINFLMNQLKILFQSNDVKYLMYINHILNTFDECIVVSIENDNSLVEFWVFCIEKLLAKIIEKLNDSTVAAATNSIIKNFAQIIYKFLSKLSSISIEKWKIFATRMLSKNDVDKIINFESSIENNKVIDQDKINNKMELYFHMLYCHLKTRPIDYFEEDCLSEFILEKIDNYSDFNHHHNHRLIGMCMAEMAYLSDSSLKLIIIETFDRISNSNESIGQLYFNSALWIMKSLFVMKKQQLLCECIERLLNISMNNDHFQSIIIQLPDIIFSKNDYWQSNYTEDDFRANNNTEKNNNNDALIFDEVLELFSKYYQQHQKQFILQIILKNLNYKLLFTKQLNQNDIHLIVNSLIVFQEHQSSPEIQSNCLQFLYKNILQEKSSIIESQLYKIFDRLLLMAKYSKSLKIRSEALNSLAKLIDLYGENHLLKLRSKYIYELRPTLSDHKRLVRSSAVKAYFKLSILGQPGNNKKLKELY